MPISLQQPPSEYSTQSQINKRENKVRKTHNVCTVAWERYHFKLRGQEKVPFSHRQFEKEYNDEILPHAFTVITQRISLYQLFTLYALFFHL